MHHSTQRWDCKRPFSVVEHTKFAKKSNFIQVFAKLYTHFHPDSFFINKTDVGQSGLSGRREYWRLIYL